MSSKPVKATKNKTAKPTPSIDLYRKVVISFVVLTAILVIIVLYFSFVSVKITVIPQPQTVSADFDVEVIEGDDGLVANQINGVFFSKEVAGEKEFTATGSKAITSDVVGKVKIVNDDRHPQPLVATTRLLSGDNILLRLKDRVDVPASGLVEAEVYADDPVTLEGKILPEGTHFNIPGLLPQKQDKIFAEAITPIKLGEYRVVVVTNEDIDNAKKELLAQLEEQILSDLGIDGQVARAIEIKPGQLEVSAAVNDEVEKFTVKIAATASGVFFDKESMIALAEDKMRTSLPPDQALLKVNYDTLAHEIKAIDLRNKTATVHVYLDGLSAIRLNSSLFDRDKIKGLNEQELRDYFSQSGSIKEVLIDFFPFWVKKTPQLSDHIDIIIN